MADLLPTVQRTIATHSLAAPGAPLVAAVSGGPDSTCLLDVLHRLGFTLTVAHLDHGLRPQSASDRQFVEELARRYHLPVYAERADVAAIARQRKRGLEETARAVRYSFLSRLAKQVGAQAIALGHTKSDQAETVLLWLVRGAGSRGLSGMPYRRGHLIRPLLDVSRADVLQHLSERGLEYRLDASNADITLRRNRIRHQLLPLLAELNPDIEEALCRSAELRRAEWEYLDHLARHWLQRHQTPQGVEVARLAAQPQALQRLVLLQMLEDSSLEADFQAVERLRSALERSPARVTLGKEHLGRVAGGYVQIISPPLIPQNDEQLAQTLPPQVDLERARAFAPLVYRRRRRGDRIKLRAGTRKLSDVLIDAKVPREERDQLRVLASGSQVLWVEGVAVDVRVAAGAVEDDARHWMYQALAEARQALQEGEVPVGAVVVRQGRIIGRGHNRREAGDPTAHAEVLALQEAAQNIGSWRLEDCTLYVTLEPCTMCYGALVQARISQVVYGASDPKAGALGGLVDLREVPYPHQVAVRGGVLAKECGKMLSDLFRRRRNPV
ncbi:MAG: tRNA lysidine(34) synthetase TilS [Deinococcus sp.]|nr:tRNA lysidine(34) synthetase TilS [Deinococcus sp.]